MNNIKLLKILNFFEGFIIFAPVGVLYYYQVTESYTQAGMLMAIGALAIALFEVPTGLMSDYLGRKQIVIIGSIFAIAATIALSLANGFWMICLGKIFMGVQRSFFSGNNDALTYETLQDQNQEKDYLRQKGRQLSYYHLAIAISAGLCVLIVYFLGMRYAFILTSIPATLLAIGSLFLANPESKAEHLKSNIFADLKDSLKLFRNNRQLKYFSISDILQNGSSRVSYKFKDNFMALIWPAWSIGLLYLANNLMIVVSSRYADYFVKKFGDFKVFFYGSFITRMIALIPSVFVTPLTPLLNSFTGFTFGTLRAATSSVLQTNFSDKQRATMGSLISLGTNIVYAVLFVLLGLIADNIGPRVTYIALTIAMLPILLLYKRSFGK